MSGEQCEMFQFMDVADLRQIIDSARTRYGVYQHQFSYGAIRCYSHIGRTDIRWRWTGSALVMCGGYGHKREKWYCFGEDAAPESARNRAVYFPKKTVGASKRKEIMYDLREVFNPSAYCNAKKRYKALVYPDKFCKRESICVREAVSEDRKQIKQIYEEWVSVKRNDSSTFQQGLATARYRDSVSIAFMEPQRFQIFVAEREGVILAARVVEYMGEYGYDIAFFGTYSVSQLMEYFETITLRMLKGIGVVYLNCGAALHSRLATFKRHLPSSEVAYWER